MQGHMASLLKSKLFKLVLVGIGLVIILAFIYLPGYTKIQQLKDQNRLLEDKILKATEDIDKLEEENRRLKEDPFYIEKIAREKLGLVHKDEVIINIPNE